MRQVFGITMIIVKPITHESFLSDIECFQKLYSLPDRDIGRLALNDTAFLLRIRAGKSPTLARVEKVYEFMIEYIGRNPQ
jgi:hypothetical protein